MTWTDPMDRIDFPLRAQVTPAQQTAQDARLAVLRRAVDEEDYRQLCLALGLSA